LAISPRTRVANLRSPGIPPVGASFVSRASGPSRGGYGFLTGSRGLISPRGPVATIARGEWKVIVVFTNGALIDRIASNCRRIEILQHDMSTVSANKIVATCT